MSDRIQQALDGDLAINELTPDECAELHRYRATICMALGQIQQWPSIDVAPEVMRRVAPGPTRHALGVLMHYLWVPRALSVRPLYGMAGALAVAMMLWISTSKP